MPHSSPAKISIGSILFLSIGVVVHICILLTVFFWEISAALNDESLDDEFGVDVSNAFSIIDVGVDRLRHDITVWQMVSVIYYLTPIMLKGIPTLWTLKSVPLFGLVDRFSQCCVAPLIICTIVFLITIICQPKSFLAIAMIEIVAVVILIITIDFYASFVKVKNSFRSNKKQNDIYKTSRRQQYYRHTKYKLR